MARHGIGNFAFRVGETFIYRVTVENDVGTEATPDLKVVWRLPPELEFVAGTSDRQATVRGSGITAESDSFARRNNEPITVALQVRVLTAPATGLVKTHAIVYRSSDVAELSRETESTTIKN